MKIIYTVNEMQTIAKQLQGKQIGFVPTMGFLHEGHLSLARKAREENDIVVMSIFVNPLQFGPNEDFDQYPRNEKRDIELAELVGVDYLFYPTEGQMYPRKLSLQMEMTDRVHVLCGASRPGHFDGVITVVTKLFHIVQPTAAYFGLKDAQQVAVIQALISDLNFPIKLKAIATIREEDGLAMSSRNKYLSDKERTNAVELIKSLRMAQQQILSGKKNVDEIQSDIIDYLQKHCHGKIDYVQLWEYPSLQPATITTEQLVIAVAVKYEQARLIDNIILDWQGNVIEDVQF